MQVRVLFFGILKDLAGRSSEELTLPDAATVADLVDLYEQRFAGLRQMLPAIAISVNQEYSTPQVQLHSGDEVGLLPPVSGGAPPVNASPAKMTTRIVREKIDAAAILAQIKDPADGAVVLFDGVVRNNTRGRQTLFLDYEAYEEMALKQLESLAEEAHSRFQIREVAILHRLGRLEIGETSVLIAVASAHRAAAFDACRWLIDRLKQTVPIWKKEHFADGAVWANGEPFPEQLTAGTISRGPASK